MSEYWFTVQYKPGKNTIPPDDGAPAQDGTYDEGEIWVFVGEIEGGKLINEEGQYEQHLIEVIK